MIIYVRVKRARCMNINERSSLFPSRSFVDIPPRLLISQPGFQFLLHFLTRVWQTREARTMREGDYEDVKGVFTIQVTGTPRILNSFELATFSTIIIPLYFSFSSAKRIWSRFFHDENFPNRSIIASSLFSSDVDWRELTRRELELKECVDRQGRKSGNEERVFRSSLITHLLSREEEKSPSPFLCYTCLDCATVIALLDFRNARFLATSLKTK